VEAGGSDMMKEEFEKRIGLVITSDEYETVEAAYMGMPESVNKDEFVKIWLKEGGIQSLFNKRLLQANSLMGHVKLLEKQLKNAEGQSEICRRDIKALKEKLATIGAVVADA
jgi:phage shock protein A